MRVRYVAHVKQQLEISGIAILVTKAEYLNAHGRALVVRAKPFQQKTAQCVDCMIRSVDDLIGKRTNASHGSSLGAYGRRQTLAILSRMRTPGFTKSVLQDFVGGFKKKHLHAQAGVAQR